MTKALQFPSIVVGALLILSILLVCIDRSYAQACDQCSHPRVALYDAQVLVPRPADTDSLVNWRGLQWSMSVARATLDNADPTRDCISWYDGGLINAWINDSVSGRLLAGAGYTNLPQDGSINTVDYLITGRVSGGKGSRTDVTNIVAAYGTGTVTQTRTLNATLSLKGLVTNVVDTGQPRLIFHFVQNYPNPFNPSTIINHEIPSTCYVTLKIYDVLGSQVRTMVNKIEMPGDYQVRFDGSSLPSGVYFYRLVAGSYSEVRKLVLMK